MEILLPRMYNSKAICREISIQRPLFFLAGPVRGGGWWQVEMARRLEALVPECILAIPTRWDEDHPLAKHFIRSDMDQFSRQLLWERFYLEEAGASTVPGCIIFWFGCENKDFPHPGPEPYAMDTRREFGKWGYRFTKEQARVVFGAESGFYGLDVMQTELSEDIGHLVRFFKTMEDTAQAAVRTVYRSIGRE